MIQISRPAPRHRCAKASAAPMPAHPDRRAAAARDRESPRPLGSDLAAGATGRSDAAAAHRRGRFVGCLRRLGIDRGRARSSRVAGVSLVLVGLSLGRPIGPHTVISGGRLASLRSTRDLQHHGNRPGRGQTYDRPGRASRSRVNASAFEHPQARALGRGSGRVLRRLGADVAAAWSGPGEDRRARDLRSRRTCRPQGADPEHLLWRT